MSDTTPRAALPLLVIWPCSIDKWEIPLQFPTMTDKVTMDSAGRVLIPRALRDELRLHPGDTLALDTDGEAVTLKPVRPESAMRKERGVWVFRSGAKISAAETDEALVRLRVTRGRPVASPKR
ncbi:MAG TPA: AbrB/MazE/SpoVT family DNA-binding domain-containing protein [Rhizomicrobium sp.]|jgi:AbrB family looped-hinge helix DNA binding protein|nr:AbrB/MazE/SpoVT family DNA-binding domain-containing protein [Rhizomicrobium sp.]